MASREETLLSLVSAQGHEGDDEIRPLGVHAWPSRRASRMSRRRIRAASRRAASRFLTSTPREAKNRNGPMVTASKIQKAVIVDPRFTLAHHQIGVNRG